MLTVQPRYTPEYQRLVQYAQATTVAEKPMDKIAIVQRLVQEARNHPAFLAPLCFSIDRLDATGQPLPMWPEWFHVEWLNEALNPDIHTSLLLAARGHAKSEYYSAVLPAWLLGKNPRLRILHVTSSDELALMYSRRLMQVIQSPEYRMVFPDFPGPGKKFTEHEWYLNIMGQRDPTWRARGSGSGITGGRADCLPAGTMVETEAGPMDIAKLVRCPKPPRVLSYRHSDGSLVYESIVASREVFADELIELHTRNGCGIQATTDHRIFDSVGEYRKAELFKIGDGVVTCDNTLLSCTTISAVKYIRGNTPVYDIQVAGDHNFFANGILVHNCIILDDAVTLNNSLTPYARERLLQWYQATLVPILVPQTGKMLVIGTRYYKDDLYGTFLEGGIEPLLYPAEDEAGHILWPYRFNRETLDQKKEPPNGSLASYASQYLCQPINPEGEVFKREWFDVVSSSDDLLELWWSWDTAVSEKTNADFTAGVLGGVGRDGNVYLCNVARGQWEPHVSKKRIVEEWDMSKSKWGSLLRGILVEDTKEGRVIQAWLRESARHIPVVMVPTLGQDKMLRASFVTPYCEAHRVKCVAGRYTQAFLEELMEFTPTKRHAHDDMVDAMVYLVCRLLKLQRTGGGSYQAFTGGRIR